MEESKNVLPIDFSNLLIKGEELNSLFITFYFHVDNNLKRPEHFNILIYNCREYLKGLGVQLSVNELGGGYSEGFNDFKYFYINFFSPSNAIGDTLALQIGISTELNAEAGWRKMKEQLRLMLKDWKIETEKHFTNDINYLLGYTTVYKSNVEELELFKDKILSNSILQQVQPVFHDSTGTNITYHNNKNGSLRLVQIPKEGGFASCMTYVALNQIGTNNSLVYDYIFFNGGILINSDVLVHKAAYQYLQLTNESFYQFNNKLDGLLQGVKDLLEVLNTKKGGNNENGIQKIAAQLLLVISPYAEYMLLEKSLLKQKKNFEILYTHYLRIAESASNAIFSFQQNLILDQVDGCQLILSKASIITEQTKTAISLIEAQQNKINNQTSERIQLTLAILGSGLAFIQIFDNDSANGLLKSLDILSINQTPGWQMIFFTKIIVSILLIMVVWLIVASINLIKRTKA